MIDDSLKEKNAVQSKDYITECSGVVNFIAHCCRSSHYSFDKNLKCGSPSCTMCKSPRLPGEVIFEKLHFLPHPTSKEDGHYAPFAEVFGKATSEEH